MTESNKPRLPKPESLEAKFKLMTTLPYDKRAKRKHSLVFGFVLDWFHSEYGNALASVRHIVATLKERDPDGIGLYTGDVHGALTDLVTWGYLSQQKGAGRAASRYVPCWDLVCVHKTQNATDDQISVRGNPNTDVRETPNTKGDSVREIQNEDPYTGPGQRTGPHVMGNMFSEPAAPPPAVGLEATAAGSTEGGGDRFADFWKAWPRKHGKAKATKEWKKLAHDTDLVSHIIVTARIWAKHYAEHGTDMKWIPEPANWLAGERWDEDLPIVHIDAKGAAITKAKANSKAAPTETRGSGPRTVDITDSDVENSNGKILLTLYFTERDRPKTWEHVIVLQHPDMKTQQAGQAEFADLCRALGVSGVDESYELHLPVRILQGLKGKMEYLPAPSNDNQREAA